VEQLAKTFLENGFKSATACRVMAQGILRQNDDEKIRNSIKKRMDASPEEKQKMEDDANKFYEDKKKKQEKAAS